MTEDKLFRTPAPGKSEPPPEESEHGTSPEEARANLAMNADKRRDWQSEPAPVESGETADETEANRAINAGKSRERSDRRKPEPGAGISRATSIPD